MITKAGRKYIVENDFSSISADNLILNLGNSTDMTTSDSGVESLGETLITANNVSVQKDSDGLQYTIVGTFNNIVNPIDVSCLGVKIGSENNSILFSRLNFPTYYLSPNQTIEVTYKIYF